MEHGYSVHTSLLLYHLAEKNCGNTVDDDCHHVSAQLVKWPDVDSSYCMDWIQMLPLPVAICHPQVVDLTKMQAIIHN